MDAVKVIEEVIAKFRELDKPSRIYLMRMLRSEQVKLG